MQIERSGYQDPFNTPPLPASVGTTIADLTQGKERFKIEVLRTGEIEPTIISVEIRHTDPRNFFESHKWVQLKVQFKGKEMPVWVKTADLAKNLGCSPKSIIKAAVANELEHWMHVAKPYEQMKKEFHLTGALTKDQIRTVCKIIQSSNLAASAQKHFAKESDSPVKKEAESAYVHPSQDNLPVEIRVHRDNRVVVSLIGKDKQATGKLGAGAYKIVHMGVDFSASTPIAVALPKSANQLAKDSDSDATESEVQGIKALFAKAVAETAQKDLQQEAQFLMEFQGIKEVVRIIKYFSVDGKQGMDIEYCNMGSLTKHIPSATLKHRERLEVFRDALKGLSKLHKKGVIHCDMKPDNLLLKSSVDADGKRVVEGRISDFGKMIRLNEAHKGGTKKYLSPEVAGKDKVVTTGIDAWAAGLIGLELFYGKHEIDQLTKKDGTLDYEKLQLRLQVLSKQGPVGACIAKLLDPNHATRMTAEQGLAELTKIINALN